jgi:hypothetical protein
MASDNFVDYVKYIVLPETGVGVPRTSDVKNTFRKEALMEETADAEVMSFYVATNNFGLYYT